VEDAPDFDDSSWSYPVQKEVTSASTVSRNVESAEAPRDLVSGLGPGNVGTVGKFADRPNQCVPIESGLPRAKILSGPFEDIGKIELRRSAEANAPSRLDHEALFSRSGNDLLGEVIQINLQVLDIFELFELAPIQCGEAHASRFS